MKILWLLILIGNVNCAPFPKDSKKSTINLQTLVDEMAEFDKDEPGFCENQIDYKGANISLANPLIHLNWDKSKTSPCIVAFETAYNAYYNQEPGMAVSKTIFEDFFDVIYDSGPFQVLVNKFNASGHEWFFNGKTLDTKANITKKMTDIWNFKTYQGKRVTTFKHLFFGEINTVKERSGKTFQVFDGLHSWLGFYYMQKDKKVFIDKVNFKRFDVVANIDLHYKVKPTETTRYNKTYNSMLMNKSPSFEFALYTALILLHERDPLKDNSTESTINIDDCKITFKIVYQNYVDTNKKTYKLIKTIYPFKFGATEGKCADNYNERAKCCKEKTHLHPGKITNRRPRNRALHERH